MLTAELACTPAAALTMLGNSPEAVKHPLAALGPCNRLMVPAAAGDAGMLSLPAPQVQRCPCWAMAERQ